MCLGVLFFGFQATPVFFCQYIYIYIYIYNHHFSSQFLMHFQSKNKQFCFPFFNHWSSSVKHKMIVVILSSSMLKLNFFQASRMNIVFFSPNSRGRFFSLMPKKTKFFFSFSVFLHWFNVSIILVHQIPNDIHRILKIHFLFTIIPVQLFIFFFFQRVFLFLVKSYTNHKYVCYFITPF